MSSNLLKLLLISTPVGPLGSGIGGGVELTLLNLANILQERGHQVTVVAPEGSILESINVVEISGNLQIMAQSQDRDTPIILPPDSVLEKMWDYARQVQNNYDLIINFSYDWLPLYLTPFFHIKVAHWISMGSLTTAMDNIIKKIVEQFPKAVFFHTKTQAETFNFSQKNFIFLQSGISLEQYQFCAKPKNQLAWLGRIAPEKALEDAVSAAKITGIPLKIMGKMQDEAYWDKINQDYPNAPIEYLGFLSTNELQKHLRDCRALLMTPRWVEAFGNVAIEALACGVPVIAYRRGGPTEIVREGETGWLVEPDSVEGLVEAIQKLDKIDRLCCRKQAETEYSLEVWGHRVEKWLFEVIQS
ncbi:glycosyl transferases group 1 family protein [Lyngbya aestuarii BL J]|uniref:Glycosyl transferases group 1 family protein n=1 Tax=Lyngbya aestuarii BL J TaxID=1348334 RepID=U7QG20_9CYAN|nr:glycosyltransferase family 4 protein [Lyngbya aestuarii]ERT06232.1 glycosyl transferases group 1 family protein [Lyngbya aestuarii BL J]